MEKAAVQVAGQEHASAGRRQRQQGRLQEAGSAIDAKPAAPGSQQRRAAPLGLRHGAVWQQRTAPGGKFGTVPGSRTASQKLAQGAWQGAPLTMGGQMKRQGRSRPQKGEERSRGPGAFGGWTHGG